MSKFVVPSSLKKTLIKPLFSWQVLMIISSSNSIFLMFNDTKHSFTEARVSDGLFSVGFITVRSLISSPMFGKVLKRERFTSPKLYSHVMKLDAYLFTNDVSRFGLRSRKSAIAMISSTIPSREARLIHVIFQVFFMFVSVKKV